MISDVHVVLHVPFIFVIGQSDQFNMTQITFADQFYSSLNIEGMLF